MFENSQGQPKLAVGREHIECDAPGCFRSGPPKRCSRCHRTFYCNVKCQRAHWGDSHKEDCCDIADIRGQQVQVLNIRDDDDGKEEAKEREDNEERKALSNTCCYICLSETMVDPFTLPKCGHAFCFSCLQKWQDFTSKSQSQSSFWSGNQQQQQGPTCPACRVEAPDLYKSIHETALLNVVRASNNDLTEEERRKISELALTEIDKVDTGATMDPDKRTPMLFTRAEILQQLKRPEEALKALQEIEGLHQEGEKNYQEILRLVNALEIANIEGRMDDFDAIDQEIKRIQESHCSVARLENDAVVDLYLIMAECMGVMEDYTGAKDVYEFKVMPAMDANHDNIIPPQQRRMFMGVSRAAYYMEDYELSIRLGREAIKLNRYFPQIHKYVALSQKASGKLEAAIKTMGRAVNYETPWDEANRKIVIKMYEELLKEQSSVGDSSTAEGYILV